MNPEIFNGALDSIKEKVGEETAAIIADDLGTLITAQNEALTEKQNYEKKIDTLTVTNQQLVASNANLLQKIPVNEENTLVPNTSTQSAPAPYDRRDSFDKFGRLKR